MTEQTQAAPDAATNSNVALAAKMLAERNALAAASTPAPTPAANAPEPQMQAQLPQTDTEAAAPAFKRFYCTHPNSTFVFSGGKVVRFTNGWYQTVSEDEEKELLAVCGKTAIHEEQNAPLSAQEMLLAAVQLQQSREASTATRELLEAAKRRQA